MKSIGPRLPSRVLLPLAPLMPSWHVRDALSASKAVLHLWRRNYAFPPSHRERSDTFTSTDAIADWLESRGVKVTRQ